MAARATPIYEAATEKLTPTLLEHEIVQDVLSRKHANDVAG